MNRREFITTGSAAAAALTGTMTAANAQAEPGHAPGHDTHRMIVALPWADEIKGPGDIALRVLRRVEDLSEGRFRFTIRHETGFGATGGMAEDDAAPEIAFGSEHDMVRRNPAFAYFAGLPGKTALDGTALAHWLDAAGGQSFWDDLARPFGYHPVLCGHLGAGPQIFSHAPIHDVSNFRDLAIYAPGLSGRVADGLGAVSSPMLDFADAPAEFAARRIGAIETGSLYQAMQMGLHRHGRHVSSLSLTPAGSTLCMRMALSTWDRLAAADRALFQLAAREIYVTTLTETRLHHEVIGRALSEQHGTVFGHETRELQAAVARVSDAVVAHAAGHDAASRAIDGSYRAFRARFVNTSRMDDPLV